jgi:hypothetical protein
MFRARKMLNGRSLHIITFITRAILLLSVFAISEAQASTVTAYTGINCVGQVNGNGCVVQETNSGPVATAEQSGVLQSYVFDSNNNPVPVYGSASATANLADGTLHAAASAPSSAYGGRSSRVVAEMEDVVTFDLRQVTSAQNFDFSIFVEGIVYAGSAVGLDVSLQQWGIVPVANTTVAHELVAGWLGPHDAADPAGAFLFTASGAWDTLNPNFFSGSFSLDPGYEYSIRLLMTLTGGGTFDFGNTAAFHLDSPVPFTSESGYFLTANDASEVPLPAALPLFAAGLGAMGFTGWRRKRAVS